MSIKGFKINDKIEKIDYESLENRPFYTKTVNEIDGNIIIPLQEVEGASSELEGYLNFALEELDSKLTSIVDKGQYNLTIDGTTEQITTIYNSDMECFLFGNLNIIGMGDSTGETYVGIIFAQYSDHDGLSASLILTLPATETTHTIELSHIGDAVPIIVEDAYSFEAMDNGVGRYFTNIWEASFEGDNVYNLTFDDEIYEGLSWIYHEDSGMNYLGNPYLVRIGDDTGEKYFLARIPQDDGSAMLLMATSYEAGDYTVSLEKSLVKTSEIIHKIDSKYLDVSHIEKDMDKLQNNLDKLNNFVGTSYSEQLYERYGLNRSEYPYIIITVFYMFVDSDIDNDDECKISLYFTKSFPNFSSIDDYVIQLHKNDYQKIFLTFTGNFKENWEDVELKTIINHLVQASDSDVVISSDYITHLYPKSVKYVYYNYEDKVMNELTNSSMLDADVSTLQSEVCNIKSTLTKKLVPDGLIVNSTTANSTKKFKITVDDNGTISAVEVME